MSDRMPTPQALEQLREVIAILRELSNAGPRDQSFKQWRQVTLTLLQRIWPNDQANAARFRRIPFSPPSSRADARTVRECYERGVCEAIAYLESLVQEIEGGTSRLGRKLVRPAEAPLASAREPERLPEPPTDVVGAEAPLAPVDPPPAPPASWTREPQAPPAPVKPPPAPAAPERPAPAARPAPARADLPPYGSPGRPERRSKPRLKDMLGFGDDAPAPAAKAPAPPAAPAPAPPVESAPPKPIERIVPPIPAAAREPEVEYEFPVEPLDELADEPTDESMGEGATWSAPVIPFPGHKVVVGRPSPSKPSAPPADDVDEGAYDIDYDPAAEAGFEVEPPPATLREMLDRAARPSRAASPPAAREVLAMASAVDHLGVPPQRRTIVRAALIDLGHQMETPPVQWAAIRQAMAFMMDYPQIARRVLPMLLPYLDEAA